MIITKFVGSVHISVQEGWFWSNSRSEPMLSHSRAFLCNKALLLFILSWDNPGAGFKLMMDFFS